MSSCDVLILSPHPDDAEIFCGATAAAMAAAGHTVRIADLTRGELASNGTPETRREESLRAARALGVDLERPVLDLPDGGLDERDPEQVARVVTLLREQRPTLLMAPWPHDRHPDHEAGGRLARRAAFLAGVGRHQAEVGPGPHRPERMLFYPCHHDVRVDLVLEVEATMDAWRSAVRCYRTQFDQRGGDRATYVNRPGFLEAHESRRAHWGSLIGRGFAEAFVHEGPWPVASASGLLGSIAGKWRSERDSAADARRDHQLRHPGWERNRRHRAGPGARSS